MTEYWLVARPYIPFIPWALAVLLGVAFLRMWREAREAKRAVREARREAATARGEATAIREIMSKRHHEIGILQGDLERREKELDGLRGKINRNWMGDLTFEALRARRKGGEVRIFRETTPIEEAVTTGKLRFEHPSGDVFLLNWDLQLGVKEPAGEKVTA